MRRLLFWRLSHSEARMVRGGRQKFREAGVRRVEPRRERRERGGRTGRSELRRLRGGDRRRSRCEAWLERLPGPAVRDAIDGDAWKFGGKLGDFERFDKMVLRRCRKRLGAMGEDFWYNSLPDFESMTTDYEWNEYCEAVLDVIEEQDSTRAKYLRS